LRRRGPKKTDGDRKRGPAVKPGRVRTGVRQITVLVVLTAVGAGAGAGWLWLTAPERFRLETVRVTGSRRLDEAHVRRYLGLGRENLLTLDLAGVEQHLLRSPWIRSVRLKKNLPTRTLLVAMEEKTPFALLERSDGFLLLDQDGRGIEPIGKGQIPFLPVVRGLKKATSVDHETLALLRALKESRFGRGREMIEVRRHSDYGLVVTVDGVEARLGHGDYPAKLRRWATVDGSVRGMGMVVDYVDVRFENRVVVRKVKGAGKNGKAS